MFRKDDGNHKRLSNEIPDENVNSNNSSEQNSPAQYKLTPQASLTNIFLDGLTFGSPSSPKPIPNNSNNVNVGSAPKKQKLEMPEVATFVPLIVPVKIDPGSAAPKRLSINLKETQKITDGPSDIKYTFLSVIERNGFSRFPSGIGKFNGRFYEWDFSKNAIDLAKPITTTYYFTVVFNPMDSTIQLRLNRSAHAFAALSGPMIKSALNDYKRYLISQQRPNLPSSELDQLTANFKLTTEQLQNFPLKTFLANKEKEGQLEDYFDYNIAAGTLAFHHEDKNENIAKGKIAYIDYQSGLLHDKDEGYWDRFIDIMSLFKELEADKYLNRIRFQVITLPSSNNNTTSTPNNNFAPLTNEGFINNSNNIPAAVLNVKPEQFEKDDEELEDLAELAELPITNFPMGNLTYATLASILPKLPLTQPDGPIKKSPSPVATVWPANPSPVNLNKTPSPIKAPSPVKTPSPTNNEAERSASPLNHNGSMTPPNSRRGSMVPPTPKTPTRNTSSDTPSLPPRRNSIISIEPAKFTFSQAPALSISALLQQQSPPASSSRPGSPSGFRAPSPTPSGPAIPNSPGPRPPSPFGSFSSSPSTGFQPLRKASKNLMFEMDIDHTSNGETTQSDTDNNNKTASQRSPSSSK